MVTKKTVTMSAILISCFLILSINFVSASYFIISPYSAYNNLGFNTNPWNNNYIYNPYTYQRDAKFRTWILDNLDTLTNYTNSNNLQINNDPTNFDNNNNDFSTLAKKFYNDVIKDNYVNIDANHFF